MATLLFDSQKCTLCGLCLERCPFAALSMDANVISADEKCRMCGVCVKACPEKAISFEQKIDHEDKSGWNDILVYAELEQGALHPVVLELVGEGRKLAAKVGYKVHAVIVTDSGCREQAELLVKHGVDTVYVYEHPDFRGYKADCYADAVADCIAAIRPSAVLIGATPFGRSMAPRLSVRFHTGLTADCTKLDIKPNTDLVQVRPAFGGNIMAQIVIAHARPQFATVRYRVMDRALPVEEPAGRIEYMTVPEDMPKSGIRVLEMESVERQKSIEEEDLLVVAGRGVRNEEGVRLVGELAEALGAQLCFTRPMVEQGFGDPAHQIGLSGRTVKPRLIITCGVSGAIQFTSGMSGAECVVAINSDPQAQIFGIANYCIADDLYKVVPALTERIKEAKEAE